MNPWTSGWARALLLMRVCSGARSNALAACSIALAGGWTALIAGSTVAAAGVALLAAPAHGQAEDALTVGQTVRVNGDFVGRVVEVDEPTLAVFGQGPPTCSAGIHHGENAICTPAPMERQTFDMSTDAVERPVTASGRTKRLVLGVVVGGAAGAGAGYVVGPMLGMGRLSSCVGSGAFRTCGHEHTPPDVQRASDQRRGALFLGVVGATLGGLIANALTDDWVRVEPSGSREAPAPGLRLSVPVGGR